MQGVDDLVTKDGRHLWRKVNLTEEMLLQYAGTHVMRKRSIYWINPFSC